MKRPFAALFVFSSALLGLVPEWLIIENDTKIEFLAEGLTKVVPGRDTVAFINFAGVDSY